MAWNRQESRVLTALTARESGEARERGPGSTQSACGNVAHTENEGAKVRRVLESDWKLRKLPFQGSGREQAYQWVEHLSKPCEPQVRLLLLPEPKPNAAATGAHGCHAGGWCAGQRGGVLCECGWLNAAVAVYHRNHTQLARSCGLAVNLDRSMERHGSVVIPSDMVGETEGWRERKKKGRQRSATGDKYEITQTLQGTLLRAVSASLDN